ncbi:MAG TPA: cell wall-binding repeat-containing protein [Solirubrobacterales bacterium]|nr:cell wall-binding repeat-containing protein [Solirubrobacterales bacterium]
MAGKRPINADAPAAETAPTQAQEKLRAGVTPPPSPPGQPGSRKRLPFALKAIGATVLLAVVFIIAAILGGRGGGEQGTSAGPVAPAGGEQAPAKAHSAAAAQTAEELGYPSFATKNTTRVGGSDPASNAAAIALATFPSTAAGLAPAAVTLVGEEDWQGAIAASVLMAAPVRSPILISTPDGLPDTTASALDALDPQGDRSTHGARELAIGDVAGFADAAQTRAVGPGDPASTAAAIARLRDRLFGSAPAHIVLVSAQDPGFAMPAAAWAARSGDPVLFTEPEGLPAATRAVLRRHSHVPVYVLGPPSTVSARVMRQVEAIGNATKRVAGEDPVSNAIALARYSNDGFGWNVNDPGHGFVIARSDSPLDAAAAAPLSASGTWGPLLLTDSSDTLPKALRAYLLDVKPGYTSDPTRAFYNHVWIIGDQEAIDVNQQAEIDNLAELTQIGGRP